MNGARLARKRRTTVVVVFCTDSNKLPQAWHVSPVSFSRFFFLAIEDFVRDARRASPCAGMSTMNSRSRAVVRQSTYMNSSSGKSMYVKVRSLLLTCLHSWITRSIFRTQISVLIYVTLVGTSLSLSCGRSIMRV